MSEQKLEWSVKLFKEYLEVRKKFLEEKDESSYEKFCILSNYFLPIDNKALMFEAYDKLEKENKMFREALEKIMEVSGTSCLHYKIAMNALNSTSNDTNSKLTSNNINKL